jgi:hypothetical protein
MTPRPVRLQLSRRKGFSLQEHSRAVNSLPAVNCARPGRFGNPFLVATAIDSGFANKQTAAAFVVECFRDWLGPSQSGRDWWQGNESDRRRTAILSGPGDLRGKNLGCWCRLCARHAERGKPLDEDCPDCAPCHVDVLGRVSNRPLYCEEVTP